MGGQQFATIHRMVRGGLTEKAERLIQYLEGRTFLTEGKGSEKTLNWECAEGISRIATC